MDESDKKNIDEDGFEDFDDFEDFEDFGDDLDGDLTDFDEDFSDLEDDISLTEESDTTTIALGDASIEPKQDDTESPQSEKDDDKEVEASAMMDDPIVDDFAEEEDFGGDFDEDFSDIEEQFDTDLEEPESKAPKSSKLFTFAVIVIFGLIGAVIIYFQLFAGAEDENKPTPQIADVQNQVAPPKSGTVPSGDTLSAEETLDSLLSDAETQSPEEASESLDALINASADILDGSSTPQEVEGDIATPDNDLGLDDFPATPIIEDIAELSEATEDANDVNAFDPTEDQPQEDPALAEEYAEPIDIDANSDDILNASSVDPALFDDLKKELQAINARIDDLDVKIREQKNRLDDQSVDEGILSALRALEEKVSALSSGSLGSGNSKVASVPVKEVNVRQPRAVPPRNNEITVHPAIKTPDLPPQKPQINNVTTRQNKIRSVTSWVLRAAQPGRAWVSRPGSQEIESLSIGQNFAELGQITFIGQGSRGWVVQGTQGIIGQ